MNEPIRKIPKKEGVRYFVVGDLHGHVDALYRALKAEDFNFSKDKLITLGDMIDRGPDNWEALLLALEPWVIPILGNHEDMMFNALLEQDIADWYCWQGNGGDWWKWGNHCPEHMGQLLRRIRYEMAVRVQIGNVGFCHAMPPKIWDEPEPYEEADERIMWGRKYVGKEVYIENIEHVFVGHVPHDELTTCGNITYMDTGHWIDPVTRKFQMIEVSQDLF